MDWKQNLLIALEFIGNSLIFVHNAPHDIIKLNNELDFWGLPKIPLKMFRISKFIFLEIIQKDNPLYDKKNTLLENCYEYFDFDSKEIIYYNKTV